MFAHAEPGSGPTGGVEPDEAAIRQWEEARFLRMMEEIVADIRPHLPIVVDDETTLTEVSYEEDRLIYSYLVDATAPGLEDPEDFLHETWSSLQWQVCDNESMGMLFAAGKHAEYRYWSTRGRTIGRLIITPETCSEDDAGTGRVPT
jgi:hypothetical protein